MHPSAIFSIYGIVSLCDTVVKSQPSRHSLPLYGGARARH